MRDIQWRKEAWIDAVNLLLAAFLFVSPWIYGFASDPAPARNAWICGIVIGLASIWAMIAYSEWEEWISLLFGLWVLSPPGSSVSINRSLRRCESTLSSVSRSSC